MIVRRPSPCAVRKAPVPYKDGKAHGSRLSAGPRSQHRQSPRVVNGDRGKPSKGKEKKENAPKQKDDKVGLSRVLEINRLVLLLRNYKAQHREKRLLINILEGGGFVCLVFLKLLLGVNVEPFV